MQHRVTPLTADCIMPERKKNPVLVSYPTYLLFLPLSLTTFEKLHRMINATNFQLNIAHSSYLISCTKTISERKQNFDLT